MARTKTKERSASRVDVPMGATGGRTPPSKLTVALFGVSVLAAIWALMMLIPAGRVAYVYFFFYANYYFGVIALVSLSITIMIGLVSTDRLVLSIRQRVLLQSAHRTTGIIAVTALFVHLWTKVAAGNVGVIDIFIPFLASYKATFIGFGTISGWVMVLVMWTGIARSRFIGRGKPWMWRGIHAVSYLMWPIALLHGLGAGRPAATWVTVSYIVCVLGVLVGLAVRLSVSLNRKKDFASQAGTGTGTIKPVGKLVPTTTPSIKSRGRGRGADALVSDRGNAAAASGGVDSWVPAAGASRISGAPALSDAPVREPAARAVRETPTRPVSPAPVELEESRPRRRVDEAERERRRRDFDDAPTQMWQFEEDDLPAPRQRRRVEEDDVPAPRQRRAAAAERYDEATGAMSRRAMEEGIRRYADEEEEVPAPRGRRRADDGYADEPPVRSRRYAGTEFEEEPAPRPRRRYPDEDELPAPRGRRAAEAEDAPRSRRVVEDDDAPRSRRVAGDEDLPRSRRYIEAEEAPPAPRQRRYAEDDRYDEEPPRRRSSRYADDEPPRATRSSRYTDDAETAPRARRDRGADVDSADSGRHARSEFVDLAGPQYGAGRDQSAGPEYSAGPSYSDPNYLDPDETPTLIDMATRRARRAEQDPARTTPSRGARRGSRGRGTDETADDNYWRQLRGEAQ
jgi:hypothetical protein